jgi:hypothetical protein
MFKHILWAQEMNKNKQYIFQGKKPVRKSKGAVIKLDHCTTHPTPR